MGMIMAVDVAIAIPIGGAIGRIICIILSFQFVGVAAVIVMLVRTVSRD
jgi:hypothetical protein